MASAEVTHSSLPQTRINAGQIVESSSGHKQNPALLRAALPLYFETNGGQAEDSIKFLARTSDAYFLFRPAEIVIGLRSKHSPNTALPTSQPNNSQTRTVSLTFVGANPAAKMSGTAELSGKINYFTGNEQAKWRQGIPTYSRVQASDVYPGINLFHYGNQRQLEYDFVVSPGATPEAIAITVSGADRLDVDSQGDLILQLGADQIRQKKPVVYQIDHDHRKEISGVYKLVDNKTVAFQVGAYDRDLPLIIDPVLSYSTFIGGLGNDVARSIALDNSGNIFVVGDTLSTRLGTPGAYQSTFSGGYPGAGGDAFVAKFDPSGTNLLFLTYLGGNGDDAATSIALDAEGNAYVTGVTDSTNFPISSLTISDQIGGKGEPYFKLHPYDAFIAKLSNDGSQLIYSTYLGGSGSDQGLGIAVDSAFCAYVTGLTQSTNFPVTAEAFQQKLQGGLDAFVTKIASNGTSLVYSTYLGGTNTDEGQSLAIDGFGRAYITGFTQSTNFPVSTNAFQTNGPVLGLTSQAFVSILDSNGSSVVQSTLLGGLGTAVGFHIALDADGNAYVTGSEVGPGFPITPGNINNGGLFKSQDAAGSWAPSNLGLLYNEVDAIGIDPVNTDNLYVGTGRGIARSTNGGASWLVSLNSFDQVVTLAVDPSQPSTIYAGATGVLKSTDGGLSWSDSSTGMVKAVTSPTNSFATVRKLVIDPQMPSTLYAGTIKGIYKTTNGAAQWRSTALSSSSIQDLVIDPTDPTTLYAATSAGVFRSTNSGGVWKVYNEGLTNANATALTIDSSTPPNLFVGLADGALFRRLKSDTNWTLINSGLVITNIATTNLVPLGTITQLALDPTSPSTIYAGTRGGLLKSLDGGTNFSFATNGLPGLAIAALAIDPTSPSVLYVGTFNSFAGTDAFLTKLSPDLTSIFYSVALGGSGTDQGLGLVLNNAREAFVVGSTASFDFPTFQPIDYPSSFNSGSSDAFVTAVNADGSDFLFSTYLGGSGSDFGLGIALDSANDIWVVGQTFSHDFPIVGGRQPDFIGPSDAFLAKLSMSSSVVNVTFDTVPAGLSLFVDGTTNTTPVTFAWPVGSFHTVAALAQSAGTDTRYAWTSWSDGGDLVHNVAALADTNITANFILQYLLTVSSTNITVTDTNLTLNSTNSGAVSPLSGWYDAGTNLTISAIAPSGNSFEGWVGVGDGSFSGTDNPALITLNGPISETALFNGPLTNRVKVVINGDGTVSPNYNGEALKVGRSFSITAVPGKGASFSNWIVGGFAFYNPKLTFLMTNGLVLEANFVTNPFAPVVGSYAGLFFDTNVVAFESSGFFTANVTDQGKMTARIQMGNARYSFSSQVSSLGTVLATVPRPGLTSLGVFLQLDLTGSGNSFTGQINGGVWTAELLANRSVYSNTNPPPEAGKKYTLVLPAGQESLTEPGGDGYGTVTINNSGMLTFSGKLADGTAAAQKTFISSQGQWPFYVSLYSGTGVILGWMTFTDEPDSDLSGVVDWLKLPKPFTGLYPSGFTLKTEAVGSLYSFTNGAPILPLQQGQGQLVLENGGLSQSITNTFSLSDNNKVTASDKVSLSFTTTSGLFKGSAVDPATGKPVPFTGAVLQKQNNGSGNFRLSNQIGRVLILPQTE